MKMNKFFMLGLAGLAFAACNNEENVVNGFPDGKGAVTIKIVAPAVTKTVGAMNASNVEVVPADGTNVTITLTGSDSYRETITLTKDQWTAGQEVTFWNVSMPQLVEVSMNDGKKTYTSEDLVETPALQNVANVPAYGETSDFTLTPNTGSPTIGNDHQAGAEAGDQDKTYQLYSATVTMAIPMARLEVSGIKHITTGGSHQSTNCKFQTLTIAGVYLDNVYANGAGVVYSEAEEADQIEGFSVASGTLVDYRFGNNLGTGIEAVLKDDINSEKVSTNGPTDFLTVDGLWPANGNAFGYNFFGAKDAEKLPVFKIYFSNSSAKAGNDPLPAPRYAMITKYWNEGKTEQITEFLPGHIYRITSAQLTDENIIGDEGGNTLYGVEVTVTEATWTVETIKADWAN